MVLGSLIYKIPYEELTAYRIRIRGVQIPKSLTLSRLWCRVKGLMSLTHPPCTGAWAICTVLENRLMPAVQDAAGSLTEEAMGRSIYTANHETTNK